MTRVARSALLIVLMQAASSTDAFAQSLVCHVVARGETAAQAARRVTGSDQSAYQQWFQILDPSSRFVPKSQYNRIRAGWRACVIKPAIRSASSTANHVEDPDAADVSEASSSSDVPAVIMASTARASADGGHRPQPAAPDIRRRLEGEFTMLLLCAAMVVPWFAWRIVDGYLARRKTASIVQHYFVRRFVDEFERPLVRYDGERPLRSRLRFGVRRGRFKILLAPGEGRRYPNLSDHKKNVEYDVARVMSVLADDSFVSGAPYTKAGWIVVPFQFTAEPKRSGVTCISSL
jgi:hypothetical protein